MIGMSYATVVVQARLQTLNPQLEEAAMDLGARPWQVFTLVTLPMITQSLLSAWLLTFSLSLDDVVLSAFLCGPGATTMPLVIFSRARLGLDPERQRRRHRDHRRRRDRRGRGQPRGRAQRAPPRRRRGRGQPGSLTPAPMKSIPWPSYLCLAAAMAIVGAYVGFSKALVIVFPIFVLAWLRFAIAAVAMLPWLRRPAAEAPLDRRSRGLLFLESFFGNFLFSICMLFGVARSSALAAGVIMAAHARGRRAAVVARCLSERVGLRVAAGIACAIAGIALVALARDDEGELASGSLIGSAAALRRRRPARRSTSSSARSSRRRSGPKRISALINLWGLVLVTPFALWQLRGFCHRSFRPRRGGCWSSTRSPRASSPCGSG